MSTAYYIVLGVTLLAFTIFAVLAVDSLRTEIKRRNRLMDRAAWDEFQRPWR